MSPTDRLWLNSESKVSVRRCRRKAHFDVKSGQYSHYWQIRQRVFPDATRVFIYMNWSLALWNAKQLVAGKRIGTNGLRGFHIEYEYSHFDYH